MKIKEVKSNVSTSEYEGTTYYKHDLIGDDGAIVRVSGKKETAYHKPGDEVEFETTWMKDDVTYGKVKYKPREGRTGGYNNPKNDKMIAREVALKASVAAFNGGQITGPEGMKQTDAILGMAEKFYVWTIKVLDNG